MGVFFNFNLGGECARWRTHSVGSNARYSSNKYLTYIRKAFMPRTPYKKAQKYKDSFLCSNEIIISTKEARKTRCVRLHSRLDGRTNLRRFFGKPKTCNTKIRKPKRHRNNRLVYRRWYFSQNRTPSRTSKGVGGYRQAQRTHRSRGRL